MSDSEKCSFKLGKVVGKSCRAKDALVPLGDTRLIPREKRVGTSNMILGTPKLRLRGKREAAGTGKHTEARRGLGKMVGVYLSAGEAEPHLLAIVLH